MIVLTHLQILWVAQSNTVPGAGVKSHSHPYYHMFYITAGQCRFTVDGKVYDLEAGQCLLIPRQVEHTYSNETDTVADHLEIKFSVTSTAADTLLLQSGVQISDNPLIGMLFRQVLKEYTTLGIPGDDAAASYLLALLNTLTEKDRHEKQQPFLYVDATGYSELAQQIVRHLEAHYSEDLSLDSLADAVGYNKSYMCVAFKKDTNRTILDCLNMIRIRRAAELIVYSDNSLAQVADLCGFSSVSHFNQVFLKYVGITSGQCRRAYPAEIIMHSPQDHAIPENFLYSVLARRRIPLQTALAEEPGSCT